MSQLGEGGDRHSIVKADIQQYLLNTYPWQLQSEHLKTEFRDVIYDAQADPGLLRRELALLDRSYFEDVLKSRGLMTVEEIERTSFILDSVHREVLQEVIDLERFEAAQALRSKVETFLQETPRQELMSDMGSRAFTTLITDNDADVDTLKQRFSSLHQQGFAELLSTRQDMSAAEVEQLSGQFHDVVQQVLMDAYSLQDQVKERSVEQWQKLQDYLRHTDKPELNPEGIRRDIQVLMHEPNVCIHRLRQRLVQFDWDTLIQLLSQRQDLSEMDVRRIINDVEQGWSEVIHAPARLTDQARAQYHEATAALETYLRQTGKDELNPEGIKRDLQTLLDNPKVGVQAMKERLSKVDRDTLVQVLSQRDDLSEQEANQIIDDVLITIRDISHAPRRLAYRAQQMVMSFEQSLEDYLRNTDKDALNPESIKRDLQLLLNDPRLGSQKLSDRLAKIDSETVTALLAQRQDLTHEEANAIVERVLAVRNQILEQLERVQRHIQDLLKSLLVRIRDYLNSLERPELSYAAIRQDLRQIFNDPQAGLEVLQHRFAQFDRDTLVAIMSSHDAVSELDAQQIIGQIEAMRDKALQKAQQLEQQVSSRVETLKQQAYEQVEDTRRAAEMAAWWLFGTATISAIASAIGGGLAVMG